MGLDVYSYSRNVSCFQKRVQFGPFDASNDSHVKSSCCGSYKAYGVRAYSQFDGWLLSLIGKSVAVKKQWGGTVYLNKNSLREWGNRHGDSKAKWESWEGLINRVCNTYTEQHQQEKLHEEIIQLQPKDMTVHNLLLQIQPRRWRDKTDSSNDVEQSKEKFTISEQKSFEINIFETCGNNGEIKKQPSDKPKEVLLNFLSTQSKKIEKCELYKINLGAPQSSISKLLQSPLWQQVRPRLKIPSRIEFENLSDQGKEELLTAIHTNYGVQVDNLDPDAQEKIRGKRVSELKQQDKNNFWIMYADAVGVVQNAMNSDAVIHAHLTKGKSLSQKDALNFFAKLETGVVTKESIAEMLQAAGSDNLGLFDIESFGPESEDETRLVDLAKEVLQIHLAYEGIKNRALGI